GIIVVRRLRGQVYQRQLTRLSVAHDAAEIRLEVTRLWNRGVQRVIRRLAADFDDLREAIEMTRTALDRSQQLLRLEMVRARARHQDAVALQQRDRELVQPPIGGLALGDVLLALDEGRRID